ncbi:CLUMA_CG012040, isoform A, partial [Clunio marinus]
RQQTSPKVVAQRTGAARFEEYFDDDGNTSHESKLKKRFLQDPDIEPIEADPEVYQGVLGRPGVDFPVMTTIPKTNFDCKTLGNGYFADLETSCQVFHICDEGRKISFLCPNGTIFRQIDLICDWWFKVDCNSAPTHYAESSEQLQRAQRLRQTKLRHVVRSEQGFGASGEIFFRNDARTAESIQKTAAVRLPQGRALRAKNVKINKRMDNNSDDENRSDEHSNASEILYARRNSRKGKKVQDDSEEKGKEIQDTAETSSFVKDKTVYNGYTYPSPSNSNGYVYPNPNHFSYLPPSQRESTEDVRPKPEKFIKQSQPFLQEPQPFTTRPKETPSEMYASTVATLEVSTQGKVGKILETTSTTQRTETKSTASVSTYRGSTTYQSSLNSNENNSATKSFVRVQTSNLIAKDDTNIKTTTPSYDSQKINTYSTARKPNSRTKETPFYTPTIPTIRENSASTSPEPVVAEKLIETTTQPTNSEIVKHALEMMESLKDLDIDSVIEPEGDRYTGQRLGLEVPPSSGPNALHSLALYFANGDVNNTKRMIESQAAKNSKDSISSVFLSDKTVTKYEQLFTNDRKPTEPSITKLNYETTQQTSDDDFHNDLDTQQSKNPILSAAGTPQLREIAQVFTHALSAYLQDPEQFRKILSEIRPTQPPPTSLNEIPRFPGENEFVRQESAYNVPRGTSATAKPEDLEIFDFSDVTVPSKVKDEETTTESIEENTTTESSFITTTYNPQVIETLPPASSSFADKTPASRLITENSEKQANEKLRTPKELNFTPINDPYPTSLADTQAIPLRWGEEITTINPNDFEVPTVYSGLLPPFGINGTEVFKIPSNEIQAPSEETDEHLQHAQSQSFVSSRNNIYADYKQSKTYNDYLNYNEEFLRGTTNFGEKILTTTEIPEQTTIKGHFVTKAIPFTTTEAQETTTLPYPTTTTSSVDSIKTTIQDTGTFNTNSKTTISYTIFLDPLTINDGLMESEESSTVSPSPNTYLPNSKEVTDQPSSTFATTQRRGKSSFATTPLTIRFASDESNSIEPMQKRANEMFGNLNETQVNHLMNVMKKAEENKTVKRLILLLIQTCDGDDHNKTLEESRTALLNALIGMDEASGNENRNQIRIINTRREKSLELTTTTTDIPITTYKSPHHDKYTSSEGASREIDDTEAPTLAYDVTTSNPHARSNYFESESIAENENVLTTETEVPTTEIISSTTSTTEQPITYPTSNSNSRSNESKPKFRLKSKTLTVSSAGGRHQKSLGTNEDYVAESSQTSTIEHKRADARALELLRSLYSLASRWGK